MLKLERAEQEMPLVSIIVVTYNSSKYVLETLESAKLQTYQNIELIITDDSSQDNTIEICKNWLFENKERFVRTELLTVNKNSGISGNCNRGLKKSRGEWLKFIAGDDLLLLNCIQDNIQYSTNKSCSFILSKVKLSKPTDYRFMTIFDRGYKLGGEKNQVKELLKGNCIPATGMFLKRSTILELNGFDERYPMLEDYPLWVNATIKGYRIEFMDLETTIYRTHPEGISQCLNHSDNFFSQLNISENRYKIQIAFIQLKNGEVLKFVSLLIDFLVFKIIITNGNKTSKFSLKLFKFSQLIRNR